MCGAIRGVSMSVGCCWWHGRFELVVAGLRDIVFLLATSLMHVCVTFLPPPSLWTCAQPDTTRSPRPARARIPRAGRGATLYSRRMPAVLPGLLLQPQCRCAGTLSPRRASLRCTQHGPRKGPAQYGRRAALRHSAMTPSPAGARSRGRNIVLHDGSGRPAASSSWRAT